MGDKAGGTAPPHSPYNSRKGGTEMEGGLGVLMSVCRLMGEIHMA